MKTLRILLVIAMLMSLLTGCNTCNHRWQPADCSAPKTCSLCGKTEGNPTDKHQWEEATTEQPKTCAVCRATEGDAIDTDERFTTAACKPLFGNWELEYEMDGAEMSLNGMTIAMKRTIHFAKDGEMTITTQPQNMSTFKLELAQYLQQLLYEQYALSGLSQAEADAACQAQHGKTVPEFSLFRANQVGENMKSTETGVYYVEDDLLYTAEDWDSDMNEETFELTSDGKLMLTTEFAEDPQAFVRVAIVKQ